MDGESALMPYGSAVNGSPRWRPSSASRRHRPRRLTAQSRLRHAPPQDGEGQPIGQKRNLRKSEFELQKGTAGKRPAVVCETPIPLEQEISITQRPEKLHTNGEVSLRLRQRYEDPAPSSVLRAHGISKPASNSFLNRPAQNWRALERRAAGLPP